MTERELTVVRLALAFLAVGALAVGLTASFAPRSFYDDFPFLTNWVNLIPPYNDHLTTDTGGLQLAFGVLFVWAAIRPDPKLIVPVCLAWALSQLLHTIFHFRNLDNFGTADAVAQMTALISVTVMPLVPAWILRDRVSPRSP